MTSKVVYIIDPATHQPISYMPATAQEYDTLMIFSLIGELAVVAAFVWIIVRLVMPPLARVYARWIFKHWGDR